MFIESLEPRQLLSASLKGGLLNVRGSASDDNIKIQVISNRVVVRINGHKVAVQVRQGASHPYRRPRRK